MSCRSVSRSRSARSSQVMWASMPPLEAAIPDQAPPIGFGAEHLHELTAAGHEFAEALGVFGGQRADGRAHGFGKAGDDVGIQAYRSWRACRWRGRNPGSGGD